MLGFGLRSETPGAKERIKTPRNLFPIEPTCDLNASER
jgi:hypothetical protein